MESPADLQTSFTPVGRYRSAGLLMRSIPCEGNSLAMTSMAMNDSAGSTPLGNVVGPFDDVKGINDGLETTLRPAGMKQMEGERMI